MKSTISVLAVFTAILAVSYAAPQCDDFTLIECAFKIGSKFDPTDPRVPENEQEMKIRCNAILPVLECMDDAYSRCPPKDMAKEFVQFVKDQKNVEEQICEKGNDLRERMLKESVCLNQQIPELERECGNAIQVHADFMTSKNCDAHFKFRKCYIEITKRNCGSGGLQVIKDGAKPMLTFFDTVCNE